MTNGRVIKVLSDRFAVDIGGEIVYAKSRKKLKREILPLAGDIVSLENVGEEFIISRILPRRNRLLRPSVANVDLVIITLAPVPEAEFLTVDKMIVNAHKCGVHTLICINKTDIADEGFAESIRAQYEGVVDGIVRVCALSGDIAELTEVLRGKFSCFAGQSAVGKTSLINAFCGTCREVGDLSEKTGRGKNTTTDVELIEIGCNTFIADTPGFAVLELDGIEASELHLYYDEYVRIADECRYRMCTHTTEPSCAVREKVELGELSRERYARYSELYGELKEKNTHRKSWRKANELK